MAEPVHTHAAILSIGDELVRGQTLDTNSKLLSERLMLAGIEPVEHGTVGDGLVGIVDAFKRLSRRAPLIVATGGLGPTDDDLTREALAGVLGDELVEDAVALGWLTERLRSRGREVSPAQRRQALRPAGAECLRNELGTAPGLSARIDVEGHTADVFCLPGPPGEWVPMWETMIAPRLRPEAGITVRTRFINVVGLPEADAAALVPGIMARDASPQVGITASGGVLTWRIRYRGTLAPAEADRAVEAVARRIYDAMGKHIFGEGEASLASCIVKLLRARGQTLAVVESCTGGMLGHAISAVPGASWVFAGGFMTYSNEFKQRAVDVRAETLRAHGAVSAECAGEMASGGIAKTGAAWCLAITGVAGPDGGTAAKPVGTVYIALARRDAAAPLGESQNKKFEFPGGREDVRQRSVMSALAMLWFALKAGDPPARLLWEKS